MNNLKKVIYKLLNDIITSYYEDAPKTVSYPYAVYDLEGIGKDYRLEINLYDTSKNTTKIDEKCDEIKHFFDDFYYKNDDLFIETSINTINSPREDGFKRRRILIDINYYD